MRILPPVPFSHYIIVRKDLPAGVAAAMICHAAGESAFAGDELPLHTHAVVLAASDEAHLEALATRLRKVKVAYVPIFEPDTPYDGAFMAIGIIPKPTDEIRRYFGGMPLYR